MVKAALHVLFKRNLRLHVTKAAGLGLATAFARVFYKLTIYIQKKLCKVKEMRDLHYFIAGAVSSLAVPLFADKADRSLIMLIVYPRAWEVLFKELFKYKLLP